MFERFSIHARNVVTAAQAAVIDRADLSIGTEHLLIGVAEVGNPILSRFDLDVARLHRSLGQLDREALAAVGVDVDLDSLPQPRATRRRWWRRGGRSRGHIPFTAGAKNALERTLRVAVDHGHRHIGDDHILAALAVGGAGDPAVRLIRAAGVEPGVLDAAVRDELRRRAAS